MTTPFFPQPGMDSPGVGAFAVAPSDTNRLQRPARALYVGQTGNLAILCVGDTVPVTLANVQGGSIIPLSVVQVLATGTTAQSIVALV